MLCLQCSFFNPYHNLLQEGCIINFRFADEETEVLADKLFFSKISQMVNGRLTIHTLISVALEFKLFLPLHINACLAMLAYSMIYIAVES